MPAIHTCSDARALARRRLPWMVFDYIDGAAGEGQAEARNRQAIQALHLQPRILNSVADRDLSIPLFGQTCSLPFGISPMGLCNLATPGADLMLARAAAKHFIPVGVSTAASTPLERMIEEAEGHAWFQLYFSGNEAQSGVLLDRAVAAGYTTLVLTVDVPEVGRRPRELRRGFRMPFRLGVPQLFDCAVHPRWSLRTLAAGRPQLANFGGKYGAFERTASRAGADWSLLSRLRDRWPGRLVVKGVLDARDATRLRDAGVDAVQVSSHGGRQLDSAPPAIACLQRIRQAVGEDYPLFFDSGLRSGEDIVRAYATGANFVFLGRPLLFAMAARREAGLSELVDVLQAETSITLAQLGRTRLAGVNREVLVNPLH